MKLLKEMWESVNYKGYEIEYNQDTLDQAIQDAKEEGELHFTFNFFIVKNGKRLHNTKSIKEAKAWIDSHIHTSLLDTPIDIDHLMDFYESHGVDIELYQVYDWVVEDKDVSSWTLKDWIHSTLNAFKRYEYLLIKYNDNGHNNKSIKWVQEKIIKPLEKILNSNN